jgi:DNA-directed RNA polymerase subunit RPC12/RpoP
MNNHVAVNEQEEIACNVCDSKLLSFQNLKTHMRVQHMKNSETQTDIISKVGNSSQSDESESVQYKVIQNCSAKGNDTDYDEVFSEYQCFYCGFKITSEENLKCHKNKCREKFNFLKNKSGMTQKFFPPVGFPHIGFSPIGFPPNIPSSLPPLYSSWSKIS